MVPAWVVVAALAAPRIELYTMGQGEHLFERFGHAAMCVDSGEATREARCYNYGTADFGSPPSELGWDFIRGTSRFWVSVAPRKRMLDAYRASDRSVFRQVLPLTPEQARRAAEKLAHDALPENRYYSYHHLRDNCSTRLRDVIDEVTSGGLQQSTRRLSRTYRAIGRDALAGVPEALLLSDLFVGRRVDAVPTPFEAAFLPDELQSLVAERLHAPPELVYERRGPELSQGVSSHVPAVVSMAALLGVGAAAARRWSGVLAGTVARWVTALLLTAIGLAVWTAAALSPMPELRENEALMLFLPTDCLLAVLNIPKARAYARVRLAGAALVSALIAVGVFRQPLLPWVLLVAAPMTVFSFFEHETPLPAANRSSL